MVVRCKVGKEVGCERRKSVKRGKLVKRVKRLKRVKGEDGEKAKRVAGFRLG